MKFFISSPDRLGPGVRTLSLPFDCSLPLSRISVPVRLPNNKALLVDIIAINSYSIIPTSVSGLLKEEDTNVEGLQIVSPCETITKGQSDQSVVLAIQLPMFCPFSSLVLRVNDTNILT